MAKKTKNTIMNFESLIKDSEKFQRLRQELIVAVRLSLTGITNLVVKYEDQAIVDTFLKRCYNIEQLYNRTHDIDAVELQQGMPGAGHASEYIDQLIFGTFAREPSTDMGPGRIKTDIFTGARERNPDGFVNRKENLLGEVSDHILVIRNIDYCLDFCSQEPGILDSKALSIFDKFRHPNTKLGAGLLLITNAKLKFPFKIRTIEFEPVDELEANHIMETSFDLFRRSNLKFDFTKTQKQQIGRKLCGLTYTEAADAFNQAMSRSGIRNSEGKIDTIDALKTVRQLRERINRNFMEDSIGLTHLTPKPWEDYICPESSNFTYDVKKIVRDFEEIKDLRIQQERSSKNKQDIEIFEHNIDGIRTRMPHVIILYGKGGVGKSAFPIHFAGLLDFDVWDFNITATHSKWVGEGPERMREGLTKISAASHVIVRIDEYDRAIGATSASGHGMHEAHKQVESEFMNWLQNSQEENVFVKNNIFLIMTTNHKGNITGPLLRSGRADLVIDIADFDQQSMKETFLTAPRRMRNRGVLTIGFTYDEFEKAVHELDLDLLAEISARKGFTVRDVDTILQEMAAHRYYNAKGKSNLQWDSDTFAKVIEHSVGSGKSDDTCELVLGDRYLSEEEEENPQIDFPFDLQDNNDIDEFKNTKFFQ